MAVELNRNGSSQDTPLSYYYEKEEGLENITSTLYGFGLSTPSMVQFQGDKYKPSRIHLTTMLHKTQKNGLHDFELIVEHNGPSSGDGKLFICFPLKKGLSSSSSSSSSISFPLKQSPLENMMYGYGDSLYYKTSTKNHVFFCKKDMYVGGDDFPAVLDNAKVKYKEIFEPNAFDVFMNLFTRNDYKLKVIPVEDGGIFQMTTKDNNIKEGFAAPNPDTYMECELLDNESNGTNEIKMSEYALTPLNANHYERGLVIVVTAFHISLILFVGGILLPTIQCYCFPNTYFTDFITWQIVWEIIHISFLFAAIALMTMGSFTRWRKSIAVIGLYFLVLFCSNAVGMTIIKLMGEGKGNDFFFWPKAVLAPILNLTPPPFAP